VVGFQLDKNMKAIKIIAHQLNLSNIYEKLLIIIRFQPLIEMFILEN
jgi:hypothetical protein